MSQQQATHVALCYMDGDIDATLAPSEEAALAYLRDRAKDWDWELDPAHPLDRSTATIEQLSELYAEGKYDQDTAWVQIAELNTSCTIIVPE